MARKISHILLSGLGLALFSVFVVVLYSGLFSSRSSVSAQEVEQGKCIEGYIVNESKTGCEKISSDTDPDGCAQASDSSDTVERCLNESRANNDGDPINTDCDASVLDSDNCGIIKYLVNGINFLSAVATMAIIGSIMIAGYQYMTARDNSGQIQAARTRIIWSIAALLLMIFMYGFLNWVVPGGVL